MLLNLIFQNCLLSLAESIKNLGFSILVLYAHPHYAAQQDVLQYIFIFYNSYQLLYNLAYRSLNQYEIETEKLKKSLNWFVQI